MVQSRIFHVKDNRILFRCNNCNVKRSLPIPPHSRTKNVTCHKCQTITKCVLNRRLEPRQLQSGIAIMILRGGKQIDIELYDISSKGVGISLAPNQLSSVTLCDEVRFSCEWNPQIFHSNTYVIRNIEGRRVGTEGLQNSH